MKASAIGQSLCLLAFFFALAPFCHASPTVTMDIQGAYEMSLRNSSELKIARFRQRAERRRLSLGIWTFMPSLDFNVSDSRTTRYNATDTSSINVTSTLSVPVTQGGRKKMQLELQGLSLDLQNLVLAKSEDEIKDACFSLFNQIHILKLKLEAQRELEKISERQAAIAEKEFELGIIREIDLIETRVSIASLAQEIFATETGILSSEYGLKKLCGIEQEATISLITDIDDSYRGLALRSQEQRLKSDAIRNNPSILQSRFKVEESRVGNKIANSTWLPNVGLQASVQLSGEQYPLQHPNYGLRATVEFPLELMPINFSLGFSTTPDMEYGRSFSSGVSTPKTLDSIVDRQLSRVSFMQAIEENADTEEDVAFQIEQSILNYERLCKEQELIRQKMEIERQKVGIMLVQLELGQVTRVDYLEGENDLLGTRLDLLSGVLALIQAEREIEKLAGLDSGELKNIKDTKNEM